MDYILHYLYTKITTGSRLHLGNQPGNANDPLDYIRFSWLRFPGVLGLLPATTGTDAQLYLPRPGLDKMEAYAPMETNLVPRFSKIENAADTLAFANSYGFLGTAHERSVGDLGASESPAKSALAELIGAGAWSGYSEPVSVWLEQATALKKTLGLWTAIQERDANGLRMMIRGPQPDMLDWGPLYGDFLSPIRGQQGRAPKDPLTLAKVYLARAINQRLHPFSSATFVCLDSNGNLKRHSRPVNLRTALWMQLSEIVTGTRKIRFCEICGELMDVTNNTRGKKVHDRCSQRERMQRYRKTRNGEKTRK